MPTDPSFDLTSILDCLPDTEWKKFGVLMNVPEFKLLKIESQFESDGERKRSVFSVYLMEHPHPTCEHVSDIIYQLGCDKGRCCRVLDRFRFMFPTGESGM